MDHQAIKLTIIMISSPCLISRDVTFKIESFYASSQLQEENSLEVHSLESSPLRLMLDHLVHDLHFLLVLLLRTIVLIIKDPQPVLVPILVSILNKTRDLN